MEEFEFSLSMCEITRDVLDEIFDYVMSTEGCISNCRCRRPPRTTKHTTHFYRFT